MLESVKIFLSKRRIAILSIYFLIAILFLLAVPVFAADSFNLDETGTGLGLTPVAEDFSIRQTVINIVKYLIGFIGIAAIVMILYGGVRWMTAGGSVDKVAKAKKTIINAAIGLMICILSYAIVYFVAFQLGDEVFGDGSGGDGTAPYYSGGLGGGAIASHYPPRGAVGVPRNINIVVTFRDLINPGSITADTVEIRNNTQDSVNTWTNSTTDNRTFVFFPDNDLGSDAEDNIYIVTLKNGIENSEGDLIFGNLGYEYTWQFTVSIEIDVTPPTVVGIYPADNDGTAYPRNTIVQMVFSEPVIGSTGTFTIQEPNFTNIQVYAVWGVNEGLYGTFVASNNYRTTEFIPAAVCGENGCGDVMHCFLMDSMCTDIPDGEDCIHEHGVRIKTDLTPGFPFEGIVDMAGNPLDGDEDGTGGEGTEDDKTWSFDLIDELDLTPPQIIEKSPGAFENSVPLNKPVKVTFSELMMSSTLNADNLAIGIFGLEDGIPYWVTSDIAEVDIDGDLIETTIANINHDVFSSFTVHENRVLSSCQDINQNCLLIIEDRSAQGRGFIAPQLLEGLVGHWNFDEGAGMTVADLSGTGNDGTLYRLQEDDWVTNSTGSAIDYDGDKGYVNVLHDESLMFDGPFSVSLWVKLTTDPLSYKNGQPNWVPQFVSKSSWGADFRVRFWTGGKIAFATYGLSNSSLTTKNQVLFQDKYVHVVAVWDGVSKLIYIDGEENARFDGVTGQLAHLDHNLGIGANRFGSESFLGLIDNVRIYNRALTPQEVGLLYDIEFVE